MLEEGLTISIEDEVLKWDMEYKRLPSVIAWFIPRMHVSFMRRTQDMPSVVTWFGISKTSDTDFEFNSSPSEREDENGIHAVGDDPFGRLYSPLRDAVAIQGVLSEDEEANKCKEINVLAAIKIQSATRGFFDRKFFKNLRFSQRRSSKGLITSSSKKSLKTIARKQTQWMEPDGYLSNATERRIKERGEPLARHKVEEKFNALIKTRQFATLSVTFPSANDGAWEAGEARTIRWTTLGTVRVLKVGLYLYKDGEPIHLIVAGTRNAGKYIFTMPETFQPTDGYQVLVTAEDPPAAGAAHAFSARFAVARRRVGAPARRPAPLPAIALTFPVRPLWRWVCGAAHKISWTHTGGVHSVHVDLVRGDRAVLRVAAAIINVGAVDFSMPLDAPLGEGFQLRVRSVAAAAVEGLRVPFSIVDRQAALAVPRFGAPARPPA